MKKIVLFLSSLFLLSSCSNIFNSLQDAPKEEKKYKVTVLVQNEAETETINNARNAFPVFKEDLNIDFNLVCYPTAEGKDSANKKFFPYTGNRVEVSLSAGNWSVYCYRLDKTRKENCFESEPVNIVLTEENPSATVKLIEKPVILYDSTVENTLENAVKLPIKVYSDIKQVKATWDRDGNTYYQTMELSSGNCFFTMKPSPSESPYNGTYNVKFDFYGSGSSAPLLYSVMEVVTVYPYCTTTTWTPAASDLEYFTHDSNGNWIMNITQACTNNYILNSYYVDPSATYSEGYKPSGDYFEPFNNLADAVTIVNAKSVPVNPYNIYLRKGTTCELSAGLTLSKKMNISSYSKESGDTGNPTIKRKTNFDSSMITVSTTAVITGITFDGDNIEIQTNYGGGAITNTSGNTLTLIDSTIQKCKISVRNSLYGGGGILNEGTMTITNSTIQSNQCSDSNTVPGDGGGIYNKGTLNFGTTGTINIKGNTATNNGGGIYHNKSGNTLKISSNVIIGEDTTNSLATVSSCSNKAGKFGGGVYVAAGTVEIDSSKIIRNYAANGGGGVYVPSGTSLTLNGTIKNNGVGSGKEGNGIYLAGTGSVKSSANLISNIVYLYGATNKIKVIQNLSKSISVKLANPGNYTNTQKVLDGTDSYISANFSKFTVSGGWYIDPDGYLTQIQSIMVNTTRAPTSGAYGVSTVKEIMKIMEWVNNSSNLSGVTIELQKNIDLSQQTLFKGIGISSSKYFGGTFKGNNKEIKININDSTNAQGSTGFGFFGYVKNATVQELIVSGTIKKTGTTPSGHQCYVGGVIGCAENSTIKECKNNATVEGSTGAYYVGGITGYINGTSASISKCLNQGSIYSELSYAGGICGSTYGVNDNYKIINCGNAGTIKAKQYVGGIIAQGGANVSNSYNIGTLEGTDSGHSRLGGIVGGGLTTAVNIHCCFDNGNYTGSIYSKGAITGLRRAMNISECLYVQRGSAISGDGETSSGIDNILTLQNAVTELTNIRNRLDSTTKALYLEWELIDGNIGLVGL